MSGKLVSSKEAMTLFMDKVLELVYSGTLNGICNLLESGPPGRAKQSEIRSIHNWFLSLDEQGKSYVLAIVKEAIESTVFSFLVVLDNKTIGMPLIDHISDFAVSIQTYEDKEHLFNYQAKESVRLNLSYTVNGELHEKFISLIEENENRIK